MFSRKNTGMHHVIFYFRVCSVLPGQVCVLHLNVIYITVVKAVQSVTCSFFAFCKKMQLFMFSNICVLSHLSLVYLLYYFIMCAKLQFSQWDYAGICSQMVLNYWSFCLSVGGICSGNMCIMYGRICVLLCVFPRIF